MLFKQRLERVTEVHAIAFNSHRRVSFNLCSMLMTMIFINNRAQDNKYLVLTNSRSFSTFYGRTANGFTLRTATRSLNVFVKTKEIWTLVFCINHIPGFLEFDLKVLLHTEITQTSRAGMKVKQTKKVMNLRWGSEFGLIAIEGICIQLPQNIQLCMKHWNLRTNSSNKRRAMAAATI